MTSGETKKTEDIIEPIVALPMRYKPLDVHELLAYTIKSELVSGRDRDPIIRLKVPLDRLNFPRTEACWEVGESCAR